MIRRMSTKDLAAKYGKSKNSTQLVNAAIRAEIPGGEVALNWLDHLRTRHELTGSQDAEYGLAAVRSIVDAMAAEIRRRYGMPARE
jgi:hypothetical protein